MTCLKKESLPALILLATLLGGCPDARPYVAEATLQVTTTADADAVETVPTLLALSPSTSGDVAIAPIPGTDIFNVQAAATEPASAAKKANDYADKLLEHANAEDTSLQATLVKRAETPTERSDWE